MLRFLVCHQDLAARRVQLAPFLGSCYVCLVRAEGPDAAATVDNPRHISAQALNRHLPGLQNLVLFGWTPARVHLIPEPLWRLCAFLQRVAIIWLKNAVDNVLLFGLLVHHQILRPGQDHRLKAKSGKTATENVVFLFLLVRTVTAL